MWKRIVAYGTAAIMGIVCAVGFFGFLHCRNLLQRRFDDAIRCFCFRETGFYKWCKAAKARFGILNVFIGHHQLTQPVDHVERQAFIVEPKDFLLSADFLEKRVFQNQLFCVVFHESTSFCIG